MESVTPRPGGALHGRRRELAVLAAGLAAGAALAWAGLTVQDGLRTAGEVAVARLSSAVQDTVLAEWQRMLRSEEPPVAPAGERFLFHGEPPLEPLEPHPMKSPVEVGEGHTSVFRTLLDEAERLELVEHDDNGALEMVLEALGKDTEEWERPEGWLRALQLGSRLGQWFVVDEQWSHLRKVPVEFGPACESGRLPYRVLGQLSLSHLPRRIPLPFPPLFPLGLDKEDIERLDLSDDRLILGPPEDPSARFELAPMVTLLCEQGFEQGFEDPPLERRKMRALMAQVDVPVLQADHRWHLIWLDGRSFIARRAIEEQVGWFYKPPELQRALVERSALPVGFALDFDGSNENLGVALRPRVPLSDSPLAFTLRHADPASLGAAEASRLRLLRGALFVLAFACVAGGFLTARVLARERKLAGLKSAFIAGVSHDLRTPLASILLLAENLETGVAGGEDAGRYHRALRKEATRLRRLVDDVLDFSRLERGAAPKIEREGVELARFAAELDAEFRARVEGEGRPFVFERGPLPEVAVLDAHAVRRALENLLDNALKHGQGTVRLACAAGDGRLRFTVADEGPGVPAGERERVFEPFERLDARNGANGHTGGTGLGLAIVRSIARAHGGEARVRTEPAGGGAVFELDLPLEEVLA